MGAACGVSYATWYEWTVREWLAVVDVSRSLERSDGRPPVLTSNGIRTVANIWWANLRDAVERGHLVDPLLTTIEQAMQAWASTGRWR